MKGKIAVILVCMLMFSTVVGAISSTNTSTKSEDPEPFDKGYSHDILGEFFTLTTCEPCKYTHRALKNLYNGGYHPFYYVTMVYDNLKGNKWAEQRHDELGVIASPTVVWDGGYKKDVGSGTDIEYEMNRLNTSIISCGNRNVKDIDLSLDVEWLGAVNNEPEDGETLVPIEQIMHWTVSEMDIDVEVTSHETGQYNGHLHVYVTEVNSTMWDDKWGDPYTFAFLDYAWNEDVSLSGGGTWDDSIGWDGYDHQTGYGEYYENITQDNIMVIATIFDEDNDDYVDETTGFLAGVGTDPKLFDIYFGDTTPPPLVMNNTPVMSYFIHDGLNWTTTYYWKIDVWDNNGDLNSGDIWSFTTRGNDPPNIPSWPIPGNGSTGKPIDTNLSWSGGDPDGDEVTYDVYFGEFDPWNDPPQVAWNQSETTWDPPGELEFLKKYAWKIVAWDEYGLNISGDKWDFTTEQNLPPDPAYDPYPEDKATAVPVDVVITWNGSDPNSGDTIKFDVYFDDDNPPHITTHNQTVTYHDPYGQQDLTLYKTYYWRIVTWDSMDESSDTGVLEFTTGINHEPTDPEINGPDRGIPDVEYDFIFVSTDEDGHDIRYRIDWGDDTPRVNTEFYASGEEVTLSHSWENISEYTIDARAYDEHGKPSGTSHHVIVIPRTKAFNFNVLEWLFERFPNAFPILRQLLGL